MGLDGGTKITRSDVLRGSSWRLTNADASRSTRGGAISKSALLKEEQADPKEVREANLSSCRISCQSLQHPVVSDYLGNLYNKPALIEFLLARSHEHFPSVEAKHRYENVTRTAGTSLDHVKSMSDVFPLRPSTKPKAEMSLNRQASSSTAPRSDAATASARDEVADGEPAPGIPWDISKDQCPMLRQPFSNNKCVALVPCGHVVSRTLVQMLEPELKEEEGYEYMCSVCDSVFDEKLDVIELAPEAAERDKLRRLIGARKKRKRSKKAKNRDHAVKQLRLEMPSHDRDQITDGSEAQ